MYILIKQNIFEDLVFVSVHLCTNSCARTQYDTVYCWIDKLIWTAKVSLDVITTNIRGTPN